MIWIVAAGFFLGMKHALEADHVAAVSALALRSPSVRDTVRIATSWGLGHATVLVACGAVILCFGLQLPPRMEALVDGAVGLMLVAIGADLLYSVRSATLGRSRRAHLHSPAMDGVPTHTHAQRARWSTPMAVGSLHGLAGSAAVVLLSLQTIHSAAAATVYLILFGVGSVLGMVLFAMAMTMPAQRGARSSLPFLTGMQLIVGTATVALGCTMAWKGWT